MRIRIKKLHPDAVVPRYAHFGDAAVDLVATKKWKDDKGNICYGTGLAMEIPENHVGLLFPRSSVSRKIFAFAIQLELLMLVIVERLCLNSIRQEKWKTPVENIVLETE